MATERQSWVGFHTVACVAILIGLLGSAHPVQQGLLGKAPTLSSARYRITLETPQTIFQWQDAVVVVRVQNEQGLPVDGLLVALQVDPPWARYVSIRPARARTRGGMIRALLRADLVGQVRIAVRVGALIKQATITVVMPIATGHGHAEACRSRPAATDVRLGFN
jgi:hypothetical protein